MIPRLLRGGTVRRIAARSGRPSFHAWTVPTARLLPTVQMRCIRFNNVSAMQTTETDTASPLTHTRFPQRENPSAKTTSSFEEAIAHIDVGTYLIAFPIGLPTSLSRAKSALSDGLRTLLARRSSDFQQSAAADHHPVPQVPERHRFEQSASNHQSVHRDSQPVGLAAHRVHLFAGERSIQGRAPGEQPNCRPAAIQHSRTTVLSSPI